MMLESGDGKCPTRQAAVKVSDGVVVDGEKYPREYSVEREMQRLIS